MNVFALNMTQDLLFLIAVYVLLHVLCSFSVFELNVNNAGRGVNVAIFQVDTMKVVKAVRFDTYQSSEGCVFIHLGCFIEFVAL